MRNYVRTILASATVTAGILAVSSPASAAVQLCSLTGPATPTVPSCAATNTNVLVNQQTAAVVTASDNDSTTNVNYTFSSGTEASLIQVASGQADVTSSDGVIEQIVFSIIGGAADLITFNLVPLGPRSTGTDATQVTVTSIGAITGSPITTIFDLKGTGSNFFGIQATNGDSLTGLSFGGFTPTGSGIQALNQVRLNLVPTAAAVPEPSTWMLMLLGMAAVGFTMRRKEKQTLRVRYV